MRQINTSFIAVGKAQPVTKETLNYINGMSQDVVNGLYRAIGGGSNTPLLYGGEESFSGGVYTIQAGAAIVQGGTKIVSWDTFTMNTSVKPDNIYGALEEVYSTSDPIEFSNGDNESVHYDLRIKWGKLSPINPDPVDGLAYVYALKGFVPMTEQRYKKYALNFSDITFRTGSTTFNPTNGNNYILYKTNLGARVIKAQLVLEGISSYSAGSINLVSEIKVDLINFFESIGSGLLSSVSTEPIYGLGRFVNMHYSIATPPTTTNPISLGNLILGAESHLNPSDAHISLTEAVGLRVMDITTGPISVYCTMELWF